MCEKDQEIKRLSLALAERDALLREVINGKTRTQFDGDLMHRILMALSASAEPSAPVEIDEVAKAIDALAACPIAWPVKFNELTVVALRALHRAALERKP